MSVTPEDLWAQYVAARPEYADQPVPASEQFGYSPEMCDQRVQSVLDGSKRATSDLFADYAQSARGIPAPGGHWIAVDGSGTARAVLRTTVTRVGVLSSVDEEFAWDEGDGDRSRDAWLAEHRALFADNLPEDSRDLEQESVLFERFVLVWPQDRVTEGDRAALG